MLLSNMVELRGETSRIMSIKMTNYLKKLFKVADKEFPNILEYFETF